jgi:hypothetical protein
MFTDQFAVAAPGSDAEARGQFLDDVENRHEQELLQEQPVAELHAALPCGDDAADIGVRKHDHDAGSHDRRNPAWPRAQCGGAHRGLATRHRATHCQSRVIRD